MIPQRDANENRKNRRPDPEVMKLFIMRHSGHELLITAVDNPSNQQNLAHHWQAMVAMQPGVSAIR